jgi:hypothetical protein
MPGLQITTNTKAQRQSITRRIPKNSSIEEKPVKMDWTLPAPPDLDEKFRLAVANEAAALAQHLKLMIPESLEALNVANSIRRSIELDIHWREHSL